MADTTCEGFESTSAELALGIVDGHRRARLVAHAEECPRCRHRLFLLAEAADTLLELVPPAEPPAGLENAVLAHLRAARAGAGRRRRARPLLAACALVAAALIAVALAFVVASPAQPPAHPATGQRASQVRAELTTAGRRSGEIVVTESAHPWIAVSVDLSPAPGSVACRLDLRDGATVAMGSFSLQRGRGYWAVGLPRTSSPVVGASLYSPGGSQLATARLSLPR